MVSLIDDSKWIGHITRDMKRLTRVFIESLVENFANQPQMVCATLTR